MPRDPLEPKVLPKISVVICTFNRHDMLLEAIMSIELQDLPRQEFELIIVDNSDDVQARDRFRDGLQITCAHRYLDEARPGLSRARNIGIHAARAELVAFLDDDAKASAGWLRHIIEAFSTNEAAGVVGGPVRPIWAARCPDWLTPRLQSFLTIIDRGDEARLLAGEEWLSGTNIAFRTRAVTEAGLFPENLGRIRGLLLSNEELLVTKRIRDLGYTVFYDPKIEMHHRVHPDRVSQSWLRRRVFWQVLSDLFLDDLPQSCRAEDYIRRILDFLMKLAAPPRRHGTVSRHRRRAAVRGANRGDQCAGQAAGDRLCGLAQLSRGRAAIVTGGCRSVLVLSTTPPLPRDYGNRNRVHQTVSLFRRMGFSVSFLLYPIDRDWAEEVPGNYRQLVESFEYFAVVPNSRKLHQNARGYHHAIDEWWDDTIAQQLIWLFQRKSFDVLFVNYTFLAKAFEYAPPGVIKILDTHDVFSGRRELFEKFGVAPEFFYTSAEWEKVALDRADAVIAIKQSEAAALAALTQRTVFSLPYWDDRSLESRADLDELRVYDHDRPFRLGS